jgi:Holliday junction DNA helicase RuvA
MIGFLKGFVLDIFPKKIVILTTGGVGYEVFPAGSLLANCKKNEEISCYIYSVVKETEFSLYGFESIEEKDFFEKVIGISGIGPKIGLSVVSGHIDQFLKAIEQGDDKFIAKTPGIGKKMAQKIILELKGKIDLTKLGSNENLGNNMVISVNTEEALAALEGLGYTKNDILPVLEKAEKTASTEDLIKFFLSHAS